MEAEQMLASVLGMGKKLMGKEERTRDSVCMDDHCGKEVWLERVK